MSLRVFSTFTGIGGFEIGIDRAAAITGQDVEHVGYSEIDKYACSVFERHYGGVKSYGDITKINAEELPDFDCLIGGFPCQAFSVAGKRRGFADTRGTLFYDLARILRAKQPRLFCFENVKGLQNHDHGRTFRTIIAAIDELGYDCQWQVLNSKNFGVPQNRERIIIIGHLRGKPRPKVFPIARPDSETANPSGAKGQIVDLSLRQPRGYRVRHDDRAGTLDANYFKGIANQERPGVLLPVVRVPEATKSGYAEATVGDAINLQQLNSKTRRGRVGRGIANTVDTGGHQYTVQPIITPERLNKSQNGRRVKDDGEPAFTVTAQDRHGVVIDGAWIRRLTPLECERLQAFPDDWTKFGRDGEPMSDSQRYKMCGNAVTTNVIQAVFERILAS